MREQHVGVFCWHGMNNKVIITWVRLPVLIRVRYKVITRSEGRNLLVVISPVVTLQVYNSIDFHWNVTRCRGQYDWRVILNVIMRQKFISAKIIIVCFISDAGRGGAGGGLNGFYSIHCILVHCKLTEHVTIFVFVRISYPHMTFSLHSGWRSEEKLFSFHRQFSVAFYPAISCPQNDSSSNLCSKEA